MAYLGTKHSATKAGTLELSFRCERCDHRALAHVSARGSGGGFAPLGFDGDGAATRAHDSADDAYRQDALSSLRLVPCPGCGHRQPGAVIGATIGTAFVSALLLAIAALVSYLSFGTPGETTPGWYWTVVVVAVGVFAAYRVVRVVRANRRVHFQ